MDRAAIGEQIARILHNRSFAGKSQLARLLEILFLHMDSQITLKPDRVIQELWPSETKTKRSADVATEINRLRKALETYYSGEGLTDPIIICLPNRSECTPDGLREKRWIVANPRDAPHKPKAAPATPRMRPRMIAVVAAVAAICIAAFILVRIFAGDGRPQSGRLDGATLTITNAKGEELWRKSFADGFWPDYYVHGLAQRMWFGDLEGNGHFDVLLLYHPAVDPISRSTTSRAGWCRAAASGGGRSCLTSSTRAARSPTCARSRPRR